MGSGCMYDAAFRDEQSSVPIERARLVSYLAPLGFRVASKPIRQLAGGAANLNYLLTLNGRPVVLRRPPSGPLPPGAYDMGREFHMLTHLSRALSVVPRGIHLCTDPDVLGVPFQLIEYRRGITLRGTDLCNAAWTPAKGDQISTMLVQTLASIHAINPALIGLDDFGRPEGFVTRTIRGWARRGALVAAQAKVARLVSEMAGWLSAQRFGERPPTILHCDFKLDNIILHPETLVPEAVVDWDMGTRGDPLFDLATMLSYWAEAKDPECMHRLGQMPTLAEGFWSRSQAAAVYATTTGIDISDLPMMRVLAVYKLGIVFLQLHGRWQQGAFKDPTYAGFAALGEDLLLYARDIARGLAD